ncbi:GNAT family N-acetyltransferase [Actinokineospora bangkokensis]|uniref:GNAT family N-acetyltransferase n=1 Tax=Actinokineospora bangkokensis TaxID=1193682 RepID=A0A1Q9LHU6_9PSEU|nr:GNAT family N-acetyltransferase [Actinokineospora bangkokensis]OLR91584.1 GNAT family N-acetyltransferase [Actinokineospora bangkokensis]
MPSSTDIRVRPYDHPDSALLVAEVQQEYVVRYGEQDGSPVDPAEFAPPRGLFLVAYLDGRPVASGGWRTYGDDAVEVKRMYVTPAARGLGLARALLAELERAALAAGRTRVVLETGEPQPEAVRLYATSGYTATTPFGYYAGAPQSIHLAKDLTPQEQQCPSTPSAT